MYNRKMIGVLVVLVISMMLILPIQPAKAQFVLASWDYPDQYGQGIEAFAVYENSTGSWVLIGGFAPNVFPSGSGVFDNWTAGVGIKIKVYTRLNNTLVGAADLAEGKNYLRHNVTVTDTFDGSPVFSQQNFTYFASTDAYDPMYDYEYTVVLNFLPVSGVTYKVVVTYEIFY